jgi:hypothetical protein
MTDMNHALYAMLFALLLFAGMLILVEVGRRAGQQRIAVDAEGHRPTIGVIDGAVFGILGLLFAFSFSGAASRFDARRQLIVEEANDIGTAYLRLDLLPPNEQSALREKFRQYLDARIAAYQKIDDYDAINDEFIRATKLQHEIWQLAIAAPHDAGSQPARLLLLPSLNAMIDITTTRTMAMQMHPPKVVFVMLFVLTWVSSLLAGYAMAQGKLRSWIHIICFAIAMSVSFYVILDLEYPRSGLITINSFDQALVDLRNSMN